MRRPLFPLASAWVAAGLMAGCATTSPEYVREGQQYGVTEGVFHGRWWNYYERGTSFLSGGFFEEAEADFAEALRGRSSDTWSARTYGMHFVEYFPNRERGVALFHQDRLDEAEEYLERSLAPVDTARAHDYLDRVKRAKLARGLLTDTDEPVVQASLVDGAVVSNREIPVEIEARDDLAVSRVRLNGAPLHQRGSAEEVRLQESLVLDEGVHTVRLEASDLADKSTVRDVEVTVDLTGPSIGIFEPGARLVTDASKVRLSGAAADANGIESIRLGDEVLAYPQGETYAQFATEAPLRDGENTFVLVARDAAGNETFATVSVLKGSQARLAEFLMTVPEQLLRPLRFIQVKFDEPRRFFPGLAGRARFAAAEAGADAPLQIELKAPKDGSEYRKYELKVTGRVLAQTRVEHLRINDSEFDLVSAPVVEFSKRLPVQRGDNRITVAAQDDQGRQVAEELLVTGRPVVLDTPESKMSLAVMAFGGTADDSVCQSLRAQTESLLLEKGRFDVVDRIRLADVLQEQQLSAALGDPDRALELGKVIPAVGFLVADVIERGDELEIYTRAISTETSRVWVPVDTHISDKNNPEEVRFALDAIVDGLVKAFPRVPGEIVQARGADLVTNIGKADGVREGMYLLVVHEEEPIIDETTGEVLIEGNYLPVGRARITQVLDKASKAQALEREDDANLSAGMPAITM